MDKISTARDSQTPSWNQTEDRHAATTVQNAVPFPIRLNYSVWETMRYSYTLALTELWKHLICLRQNIQDQNESYNYVL